MLNWLFPVTLRFKYTGRCGEVICCYTENLHLCCWMNHSEWSSLERKALLTFFDFCLFSFILPGHSPLLREVRAGTEAEAMGEHCLVPWSLWLILNQLYHPTRITFPGWHLSQWAGPSPITTALPNHDSLSEAWPQTNVILTVPQLKLPFPRWLLIVQADNQT